MDNSLLTQENKALKDSLVPRCLYEFFLIKCILNLTEISIRTVRLKKKISPYIKPFPWEVKTRVWLKPACESEPHMGEIWDVSVCRLSVYLSLARWNSEWEQKRIIARDSRRQSRLMLCKQHSVHCVNTLLPSVRFWLWPVMSGFLWIPPWGWCLRSATSALPPLPLCREQVLLALH